MLSFARDLFDKTFLCLLSKLKLLFKIPILFYYFLSRYFLIKVMPYVEGDRSDCQPEASSIAQNRRMTAVVVVNG